MDFALPPVGEGLIEVELVRWMVSTGDKVKRGQSLMEVMSDKATMEVPAAFVGTVSETLAEPGAKVKVGQVVMRYNADGASVEAAPVLTKSPVVRGELAGVIGGGGANGRSNVLPATPPATVAAAPSVRLLARKLGVDLARVRGSGPGGRVVLDDLLQFVAPSAQGPTKKDDDRPKLDLGTPGTRTKLIGLRRKIAEHMVASKRNIPHYSYVDECDLSELVRVRAQLKETFYRSGVRLTYLPFIVKAVARALKDVPLVNATYDEQAEELTLHDRYHIGIAVAAPNGLIVPVVKDADKKDVAAIATEIDRLSTDARSGKSKLDDLKGGTFTVTSVGNIGGLISTPIINSPEVGILGVGKVVKRPVFDDAGNVKPADLVYFSFSFDHRVLDGAIGATFGNAVIRHLKHPATLLLPEKFAV
ncbi:MAG: 2-oxo acid dehydrogenase subunit E2 [Fimbriiglobus sp.]|jgi:pyruvate dehydrogenase E2 component (dihydrolipoamide acetyltransferase)/2-oxoisovalerate dehydrogenase E2 component (dihydrolipoyl transacylase)|nr:2-oxo acid dehydrogenase subunit E2 [Fimbriiglobus sp.]